MLLQVTLMPPSAALQPLLHLQRFTMLVSGANLWAKLQLFSDHLRTPVPLTARSVFASRLSLHTSQFENLCSIVKQLT